MRVNLTDARIRAPKPDPMLSGDWAGGSSAQWLH